MRTKLPATLLTLLLLAALATACGEEETDRPWPENLPENPEDGSHLDEAEDGFYEGWYHKVAIPEKEEAFFFIYGVILPKADSGVAPAAFLYCGRSSTLSTVFQTFPVEDYWAATEHRDVRIGDASRATALRFAGTAEADGNTCSWDIDYTGGVPWLETMGPLTGTEGLETSWTVGTIKAAATGWVEFNGDRVRFENVSGYCDHNWGSAFPSEWMWLQANLFPSGDAALSVSAGKVPVGPTVIKATMVGLYLDGEILTFRSPDLDIMNSEATMGHWTATGERELAKIAIEANCEVDTMFHLRVPTAQGMEPHAWESLAGTIDVTYETRADAESDWQTVFSGTSPYAGVELGE
jgi:tocopherol cyclase